MKASKWLIITLFSKFPKCYPIYEWLGTPGARSQTALFSVLMPLQTGCVAKWWRIPGFALATGCNRSTTAIWPVFLGYGDGSNFRLLQIYRPTRTLLYTYNHRRYIDHYTALKYIYYTIYKPTWGDEKPFNCYSDVHQRPTGFRLRTAIWPRFTFFQALLVLQPGDCRQRRKSPTGPGT